MQRETAAVERVFREEYGRLIASLVRRFGDIDLAEEAAGEALVAALNRAVAVAELDGPKVALALVDRLPLTGYHAWHAARADLLRRLGRSPEAKEAYAAAIASTHNSAERAYLNRRRGELV